MGDRSKLVAGIPKGGLVAEDTGTAGVLDTKRATGLLLFPLGLAGVSFCGR